MILGKSHLNVGFGLIIGHPLNWQGEVLDKRPGKLRLIAATNVAGATVANFLKPFNITDSFINSWDTIFFVTKLFYNAPR